jgi:2-polyprenyl-6-hydroxyphenyl methylase/3-demethylubiquinone-9 3-methyltransferase
MTMLKCKICSGNCDPLGKVDCLRVCADGDCFPLGKSGEYVDYHRCVDCGFIFTAAMDDYSSSDWLNKIYNPEYYAAVDKEYASERPNRQAVQLKFVLAPYKENLFALDFGGGNGQTAENMRRRGFHYQSIDPYGSKNDSGSLPSKTNFISAFEVFEHHPRPRDLMREVLGYSSDGQLIVLFCTSSLPKRLAGSPLEWNYIAPRNGHISFASTSAMRILASDFGLQYISVGNMHLLYKAEARSRAMNIAARIFFFKVARKFFG